MPEIVATPKEPENFVPFVGTFECHTCQDWVWAAKYIPEKEILTWTCDAGHVSKIEYHYG